MKIHMMMQGKGGVGKSLAAAILAQYLAHKGKAVLCIDTDPVNATFHSYKALDVEHIEIVENDEINPRHFDTLVEMVAHSNHDAVIDNGSSVFVPLSHFIFSNKVPALLSDMGHELVIHTVIVGGQAMLETVSGFADLAQQFPPETTFVVWLNPFWGPVQEDDKKFEEMKAYQTLKERINAIIHIPPMGRETFGRDFREMLQRHLTFDAALAMPSLTIMTRQRLSIIKKQFFDQLDGALLT